MLLVGSKALQAYMPLGRIIHDWDLWMSDAEFAVFNDKYKEYKVKETPHTTLYDVLGTIVEVKNESKFEPNDSKIYDLCKFDKHSNEMETQWGKVRIPQINILYDMKCATAECIKEWKHDYDKKLIEQHYQCSIEFESELYKERLAETKSRIARSDKTKFEFFHKNSLHEQKIATIPEYIEHDRLHELIADLTGVGLPTYLRITNGDVSVDTNMFDSLTHHQKLSLMVEESLVLALERWFIPQMVENGINHRLIERFYSNNEASPTYLLLKHVNIKGLIGEKPEITQFGRDNFAEIEKLWVWMKQEIRNKDGFPKWFYDELFDLRDRYRNGEEVGLHHVK